MTTIAPPLRRQAARARRASRQQVVALRGVLGLLAVVALTIPAHLSLQDRVTESAVIAAGTAFGIASLLSLVVAASIWRLSRCGAPRAALVAVSTLTAASLLNLYASLTLLWNGRSALGDFRGSMATVLVVLGLHLLAMAFLAVRLEVAPVITAVLVLAGLATLAAVFPPGWHPQTEDALVALALGQVGLIGWMAARARSSRA